jgi:hypothetical protein
MEAKKVEWAIGGGIIHNNMKREKNGFWLVRFKNICFQDLSKPTSWGNDIDKVMGLQKNI